MCNNLLLKIFIFSVALFFSDVRDSLVAAAHWTDNETICDRLTAACGLASLSCKRRT
jgi:hypothetical protein